MSRYVTITQETKAITNVVLIIMFIMDKIIILCAEKNYWKNTSLLDQIGEYSD